MIFWGGGGGAEIFRDLLCVCGGGGGGWKYFVISWGACKCEIFLDLLGGGVCGGNIS